MDNPPDPNRKVKICETSSMKRTPELLEPLKNFHSSRQIYYPLPLPFLLILKKFNQNSIEGWLKRKTPVDDSSAGVDLVPGAAVPAAGQDPDGARAPKKNVKYMKQVMFVKKNNYTHRAKNLFPSSLFFC